MFLKALIDKLKLSGLFSKFCLNIPRTKYIFQVDPILLDDEPIVDDEHGIIDNLLDLFCLCSLSFQVAIAQDSTEVGKELVQLSIEVINFVKNEGLLVSWIVRLVLFGCEL
jgi:hypothetical protein